MKTPSKIGRYQIETEVGRGSMGIVYQARDPRIARPVALKVVDFSSQWLEEGSASAAEEFRERFIRESKIAGKLSHPGIVVIYDAGEEAEDGAEQAPGERAVGRGAAGAGGPDLVGLLAARVGLGLVLPELAAQEQPRSA